MMHGPEKSDPAIVAVKPTNKAERSGAESVERRAGTKGNAGQRSTCRTQRRAGVSQELERIRKVARERKKDRFTALFHHISVDRLKGAFYQLKKDAAPGVDRLTWADYEADLERNLEALHDRVHRGAYRALPSRRVYIPKPDGRQRPLAVAALEDKIVQRAVVELLNAIYEEDFLGISYGFRPGRGTHDALDALCVGIHSKKVSWILDADIRSFFDEISQEWLIRVVEHRIGDRRIIRLIQKWLKAGVLEDGVVSISDKGTGQGSVISPLLANIYLHYALDLWAVRWRQREATGDMIIVRYADDFIIGFQHEHDARRFLDEMRERLRKFALTLHPEKTRLIEFGRFAAERRRRRGLGKPETFNFLGFTFICGKTRTGKFQLQRKSRRDRMRAKLKTIEEEMWRRMHQPIPEQGKWLARVVRGYFNYHAVPTNACALHVFLHHVTDIWRRTLRRRSQKDRITWARMTKLVNDWLPKPIILHPWPSDRFAVNHPRWEKLWGGRRRLWHLHRPHEDGGCPVEQVNDLSRSLAAFDPISTLVMVVEMSKASWLVTSMVPGIERQPLKKLESDATVLLQLIERWRNEAVRAGRPIRRIALAYEAGRDGFWLARWLAARGIEAHVIHSASVAVSRERKRAKTDRLDAAMLMRVFLGWLRGERGHCGMVAIPTIEEEDARRPNRERESLVNERSRIINRMKSALARLGIRGFKAHLRKAPERLAGLRTPEGTGLPTNTIEEFRRDMARLALVREQINSIEKTRAERLERAPDSEPHAMVRLLARVIGIGVETADMLVREILSRNLRDRRALARYAGLTGSPDESGLKSREKGLAKAGNARVRRGLIQLAWRFLIFQKDSLLARWYRTRTEGPNGARKTTMIVALARKLLIALWRLVTTGEIPDGVELRPVAGAIA
jgi:RNA-directed DNA polymerase